MHKDFIGNILEVGDEVAVTPKDYRGLVRATVVGFTAQQVRVKYVTGSNNYEVNYITWGHCMVRIPKKD